ncbi:radical SAM protein [candidate division WOR-3 bacterium]|nr:radical SAM protein [candidate division WOR-3 bacterium]
MNDLFVVFEITRECDNDCLYCYNIWKNRNFQDSGKTNIDKKKALENIIKKIKPTGICFTGGEPLLSPELPELIELCRPDVKFISLATNGKNLDRNIFSRIDLKKLDLIDISLPTLMDEKYLYICKSGGLDNVKSAVAHAKKRRFRVNLSVTAMKINLVEIIDLLRFAFAFSCDSATINFFTPSGRGAENKEELALSTDEKLGIIKIADEFSGKYGFPVIFGIPFERCKGDISLFKNLKFGSCLCGIVKFAVDFYGNVRPCEQSDLVLGNILEDDFKQMLESDKLEKFRSNNFSEDCPDCSHYSLCLGACRFSG